MVREVIVLAAEDSNHHRLYGEASPVISSIPRELWPQSTNCISNIGPRAKTMLGPAYNEFGYNEHPAIINKYLHVKIIYNNIEKFGYKAYPRTGAVKKLIDQIHTWGTSFEMFLESW